MRKGTVGIGGENGGSDEIKGVVDILDTSAVKKQNEMIECQCQQYDGYHDSGYECFSKVLFGVSTVKDFDRSPIMEKWPLSLEKSITMTLFLWMSRCLLWMV